MSTSVLPKITTYHQTNANNFMMDQSKTKTKKLTANVKSGKRQSKPREYKGTRDMQAAGPSSSQGYNFSEFHQQKRKEYPFFEQYRSTGKKCKSDTTEGHPRRRTDGTTGGITIRNESLAESDTQSSVIMIKTEKTDNGNIISTPEDEEMSTEVTETAEGIKKMTIEEIQQMRLRQQVSSTHQVCERESDSLSKGITEGDNKKMTEDDSSLQSVPKVTKRMPVSPVSMATTPGDGQMMTDSASISSLGGPTSAVQNFIAPQCRHCMHRPTMVSRETQTESPRLASYTQTETEEISIRQDVQPANNPMMQQGQLVPMTSQQMQVQPVQEHHVSLVQRSNSMEVEKYEDYDASVPVDFNTAGNSALFVSRTWTNDFGRSTLFNRFLASLVAMLGMTVCTPVLQRNKKPMVKDCESGVIQIHPDEGKLSKLTQRQPRVDWFFQHRSLYPHLSQLPNVKSVIGYLSIGEDKGLIDAAKDFKQSLYPRAKLIFFNLAIPEDFGDTEGEANALDRATEADVVFSVGHHTYHHFENKYKALFEAEPKHYLYLPPLTDMFINTKVVPTEGKQQVLSVCNVSSEADFHKYSLGAIAMGKLVNAYYHAYERLPVWSIIGVEQNMLSKFEKFLQDKADSRQLRINVHSSNSLKDFRRSLLQSVLFIAPEKVDSFNFTAYLAMQAGIPVLVPNCSGLVTFLDSLFRYKDYSGFCGVETGLHDFSLDRDGDRWKDAMISRLNANRRNISFKKANELKNDLISCEELKTSHERFLRELV
ncbi:uncharacterized protein [Ptychodera flava]|uniref:uncharacterized protein n=1 Tax=Ptychodera flava TaxID=63121 RepID=UPI003969CDD3